MCAAMEAKIRHLEMVQGVINRMAANSFMLKGWAVTLIVGIFVFASKGLNPFYFLIAYIPIALFWFLDSYYLQLERKFRVLYTKIGNREAPDLTFNIKAPVSCHADKTLYHQSLFSTTEIVFYLLTAILVTAVMIISNLG